ncbi:Amidophosphoribosyltransferase [Candidatus Calditenuaceae archaeon HR02]|nr:Amidophosphoribosyltransferase [Candidatus Calditenuaceae archaeon HR02]
MREKCGVIAAKSYSGAGVSWTIVNGLRALQHRGQEAWGISLSSGWIFKRSGLVSESIKEFRERLSNSDGCAGIGHVRYSTVGGQEHIQPIDVGPFRIAHNGTIANYRSLMNGVLSSIGEHPSDTLVAGLKLKSILSEKGYDWAEALREFSKMVAGSFCFTLDLKSGQVMAIRDPWGYRPLCIGHVEESDTYVVASESCALDLVGAKLLRDVRPGEIVYLGEDGPEFIQFEENRVRRTCAFEYTYFAHPSSVIDGVSVYGVRKRVGMLLAERYPIDGDVVIPVPDSARPAALGYAEKLGIPFEEGLIKDRYSRKGGWRSFIEPEDSSRREINSWMFPVKYSVYGKDVILVDDSIVRGVSSTEIVRTLRRAGAKSINLVVTFPPIMYPCFMGIDFPEPQELVAHRATDGSEMSLEVVGAKVAKMIGADRVVYNDPLTLAEAIEKELGELCITCHTGEYYPLRGVPLGISRKVLKG